MSEPVNLHGCAIRIGDLGILIRGPARSGKSSLALSTLRRCSALNLEALLVADDRVVVAQDGGNAISMARRRFICVRTSVTMSESLDGRHRAQKEYWRY